MIRWLFGDEGVFGEKPDHGKEVRTALRNAFTGEGEKALVIILTDLGFFDELKGRDGAPLEGEALIRASALRDYARRLLEQVGALHEGNISELVNRIMTLPVWGKKRP